MCFSERASIESFFFGIIGSLLLISLGGVNNKIFGYYFIYVSFMQFIDFLLWRHQICDDYNRMISFLGMLLNHSQPIVLGILILLFNPIHKNIIYTLMLVYLCAVIPYSLPFVTDKKLQCTLKGKEIIYYGIGTFYTFSHLKRPFYKPIIKLNYNSITIFRFVITKKIYL
jgi:hypothetical protein